MKDEAAKLAFANEYVVWKRNKESAYADLSPSAFMEEAILNEKADIYNKLYDMFIDGDPDIEEVKAVILNDQ
jgi:hypothetical protein